jgi:ribosomal protein S18 acetylase RimI-like enzyme
MQLNTRRGIPGDTESLFAVRTSVRENHQSREELAGLGVTPEAIQAMLQNPNFASWVAEADGQIVGFSMTYLSEGYVFALFIRPDFEGLGIGKKLMALTEEDARSAGISQLWLSTGNDTALRAYGFYENLGWQTDGLLEDGQVVFRKRLTVDA